MATLEELVPQFHEFIADRTTEIFERAYQQKRYPQEVQPNFKDHYLTLANSAFERVRKGSILTPSKIEDPKQKAIEDAIARFDNSLLNPKKEPQESYSNWQEAIVHLLDKKEFARLVWDVREAYKALMPQGILDKTSYNRLCESIEDAANVALKMIYLPAEEARQEAEESKQLKLSDRYDILYSSFKKEGTGYKTLNIRGSLNKEIIGPKEKTTLGRNPPKESVFMKLQPIFSTDITVSKKHLYLEENESGLVLNDISALGTYAINYKGEVTHLKRENHRERDPLPSVLVPKDIDKEKVVAGAAFGGKDGKLYQIKITLEKRL